MKKEMTLAELAKELGEDKKIRILCEDDDSYILQFSKKQQSLEEAGYSFEMGM